MLRFALRLLIYEVKYKPLTKKKLDMTAGKVEMPHFVHIALVVLRTDAVLTVNKNA